MTESLDPVAPSTKRGCLTTGVSALAGAYLASIIVYLVLRLVFGDRFWWLALVNAFAIYTFMPVLILLPMAVLFRLWAFVVRLGFVGLLGIIWFGPFFQPGTAPEPGNGSTITVMTFNMRAELPPDGAEFYTWIAEQSPDVIVFQERPQTRPDRIPELADVYPHQIEQSDYRLTLSRYAFVETSDDRVVIEIDGQPVAIYNVHSTYPILPESRFPVLNSIPVLQLIPRYDESQRNRDIAELIETLADETLPHIVIGDFNMSQHSLVYSDVAVVLRDVFREISVGLGNTWPVPLPMLRLDYVWVDDSFAPLSIAIGPDLGSDHLPLVATLELLPPSAR